MFKKGQQVVQYLSGAGYVTEEICTVLEVTKGEVWLDNGDGNDPTGPFDATTGEYTEFCIPGFSKRIAPLEA